ncbi:protease inhibitor I42 family protein [Streptomyces sp. B1866]|uniref:protease inhibitor I42 family protein n=1 Tax=Streptomyces sp. B1866 TaxID=3075431 RepID=UPI00288CB0F6|nr:protease inhibitor I42 family protein [Streptomyces sp. B1866]MDT3397270.1 protease inhibitor I42 family protein [Streptomyces sp. B1866]
MTAVATATKFLVLSEENSGQEARVQNLGLVTVALEENPSTGYHWEYMQINPSEEGQVRLLNDTFLPGNRIPGAPGARVFLLQAVSPGHTEMRFCLYPPSGAEPVKQLSFPTDIIIP